MDTFEPFDVNEDMADCGDEAEAARHFWRADMFDRQEFWNVRAPERLQRCGVQRADAECFPRCCVVQDGAHYTSVDAQGNHLLKAFNFPEVGKTGQLNGLQLGGFMLTIESDANGIQRLKNFRDFMTPPEPTTIACKAGKLVLAPGFTKMYGKHEVAWAFTQGPDRVSTVPIHLETDDIQAGAGKKMSSASKRIVLTLPGGEEGEEGEGETVEAYMGRFQNQGIVKFAGCTLFDAGAGEDDIQPLADGQANLLRLLKVPGLKLYLTLSKKIPGNPKGACLNILAQHNEINEGNPMLLFASAPVAGPPPHILQAGVLPGGKCLKDLAELPWLSELRPIMMELVKPLVDFAVYFDTAVAAKKWAKQVSVLRGIPTRMAPLVQHLSKLYKAQAKVQVETLLAFVTTNVSTNEGAWYTSGLAFDSQIKKMKKAKAKGDSESGSESGSESDSDGSDVEELFTREGEKGTPMSTPMSTRSSTRSSRGSSSGGSGGKAKAKAGGKRKASQPESSPHKRTHASHASRASAAAVGSDDEESGLGGDSDDDSDE